MFSVPAVHSCELLFFGNFCDWEVICVFASHLSILRPAVLIFFFFPQTLRKSCSVSWPLLHFAGQTQRLKGHKQPWRTPDRLFRKTSPGSWGALTFQEVYIKKQSSSIYGSPSSERIEGGDLEIRLSPSKNVCLDLMWGWHSSQGRSQVGSADTPVTWRRDTTAPSPPSYLGKHTPKFWRQ